MRIKLAYGKSGLEISLPEGLNVRIVEPVFIPGLLNPKDALEQALNHPLAPFPLRERVKPTDRVGIVFSDITRPAPNRLLVPAVLEQLRHVPVKNITLFNGLGTHRQNTPAELGELLGDALVDGYRIVQNNCFDPSTQVCLGRSSFGHEIWINRELAECDIKILTGFIEPHLFAGFSGGGKAILPGMAGLRTILGNHDATNLSNPNAIWEITRGNPVWEEMDETSRLVGPTFLLNVSLNKNKEITGIFAGGLQEAHAAGCEFVKQTAMIPVAGTFDIVITTNSGYPLDLNLYQAVKGMRAASQVVKDGGSILLAAECWDGIPEHGKYKELLHSVQNPRQLLEKVCSPGFLEMDQWQAQIQALVQLKAEVYVYADKLTPEQIRSALLLPSLSIEDTLQELLVKYGPQAAICILPEGPQTIPYLNS